MANAHQNHKTIETQRRLVKKKYTKQTHKHTHQSKHDGYRARAMQNIRCVRKKTRNTPNDT